MIFTVCFNVNRNTFLEMSGSCEIRSSAFQYPVGIDLSLATSYRPVCKAMVNRRLVWILETRNLISHAHCGFQSHRSTVDDPVNVSALFRTVSPCADSSSQSSTWRMRMTRQGGNCTLRTLGRSNHRGRLALFVSSSLHFIVAWVMVFFLHFIKKKTGCHKDRFLSVTVRICRHWDGGRCGSTLQNITVLMTSPCLTVPEAYL